ncbi:RING-H2 finger protein ATL2-like [Tripterygium wilfordii]|uniref:RING-H2 finger protein ATL2-like n=1 Tax=Tripterygium wilfordii TaxID=458696 RepID=UPI0018F7F909|nr:RING-H2 finger protein ATL2-like [Tripterygium wilfordii]
MEGVNDSPMDGRRRTNTGTIEGCQISIGAEQHILHTLPILYYSTKEHDSCQSECVICLGELEEGDSVRLLPDCGHVFHVTCVDGWFSAHTSCPVCRSPVVSPIPSVLPSFGEIGEVQGSDCDGEGSATSSSAGVKSDGHDVSIMLTDIEGVPRRFTVLKRSFSMDQSLVIMKYLQREKENSWIDPESDVSHESRSLRMQSMRQLDRMSSRLFRSFSSQLRVGPASTANGIFPY